MQTMKWTLKCFPPKKLTVDGVLTCSACGRGVYRIKGGSWFGFCPNCGAENEQKKEEQ